MSDLSDPDFWGGMTAGMLIMLIIGIAMKMSGVI